MRGAAPAGSSAGTVQAERSRRKISDANRQHGGNRASGAAAAGARALRGNARRFDLSSEGKRAGRGYTCLMASGRPATFARSRAGTCAEDAAGSVPDSALWLPVTYIAAINLPVR